MLKTKASIKWLSDYIASGIVSTYPVCTKFSYVYKNSLIISLFLCPHHPTTDMPSANCPRYFCLANENSPFSRTTGEERQVQCGIGEGQNFNRLGEIVGSIWVPQGCSLECMGVNSNLHAKSRKLCTWTLWGIFWTCAFLWQLLMLSAQCFVTRFIRSFHVCDWQWQQWWCSKKEVHIGMYPW